MKKNRGQWLYNLLWHLVRKPAEWLFSFQHDWDREQVPTLIISNHVTNFDPSGTGARWPRNETVAPESSTPPK